MTAATKFHASLNVSDLARSAAFYRVLLGVEAARRLDDYAKFEIQDPPLVLSLMPGRAGRVVPPRHRARGPGQLASWLARGGLCGWVAWWVTISVT